MADDRKRRVMEHLARSTNQVSSFQTKPSAYMVPEFGGATKLEMGDRKRQVMEHLARSTRDFDKLTPDQRKQQILDHIRLTQG